jgi:phosphoglycolate phosphatase-like HAD superfamily hydrolase
MLINGEVEATELHKNLVKFRRYKHKIYSLTYRWWWLSETMSSWVGVGDVIVKLHSATLSGLPLVIVTMRSTSFTLRTLKPTGLDDSFSLSFVHF